MAQLFHRSTNALLRFTIFCGGALIAFLALILAGVIRGPYITEQDVVREQPVQFSHEHHVAGLGIDCRYCHTTVEQTAFAGIPPTETCMNCHKQVWATSPMLEPVRASYRENHPI